MSLENNYAQLEELSGSDYEIVDGEPNIIGWDVENEQGEKIGEVDNLLFDPQSRKVRYLAVDLDKKYLDLDDSRVVLIPIGVAELHGEDGDGEYTTDDTLEENRESNDDQDADDDVVLIPNVTADQLRGLPVYEKGKLTPDHESLIRSIFEGTGLAGVAAGTDFYNHDHFNEDRFYAGGNDTGKINVIEENLQVGKREVETGGARITSRIVERPVEENINLREEHVTVERTPVDRAISSSDLNAFKEEEIELTEHAEVPVVSKEARVVEEVTLNKEVSEKEETIKDTLRHTEVDTENINPEQDR